MTAEKGSFANTAQFHDQRSKGIGVVEQYRVCRVQCYARTLKNGGQKDEKNSTMQSVADEMMRRDLWGISLATRAHGNWPSHFLPAVRPSRLSLYRSFLNFHVIICENNNFPVLIMSTLVWPPLASDQLAKEEEECLNRELEWLLSALQDTLQSLKSGLEECADLLAPKDVGSTLVLSSHRSESLKGFVTRVGTRIVKGDVQLRLASLPPPRGQNSYKVSVSAAPTAPTLALEQLTSVRTLINACLDVVDATRWTGDAGNANFISGQLKLLHDNVQEANQALKGGPDVSKQWNEDALDEKVGMRYRIWCAFLHYR